MKIILHIVAFVFTGLVVNGQDAQSMAKESFAKQDYVTAFSYAMECYEADTLNMDCLTLLASSSNRQGDQSKAKYYYHKIEKADTSNVEALMALGAIYEQQQVLPKAIKYYTLVNKKLPDNGVFFRKNAKLYTTYKEYGEAFRLYARANKINPRDIITIKGLATLFLVNDQATEADSMINTGLEIDSTHIGLRYLLAKSKYKQKSYDEVIDILEGVTGMVDLDSYHNKLLGYSYLQQDSLDKAISKFQLALVDDEDSEKLHFYLANAYEKKGEKDAALVEFQKAVQYGRSPDFDMYHRNVARIANSQKKYKLALEHYKEAYKYGKDPLVLYYIATISDLYYKDKSIAINYYKKYMKSGHQHAEYQQYASDRSHYLKEKRHLSK